MYFLKMAYVSVEPGKSQTARSAGRKKLRFESKASLLAEFPLSQGSSYLIINPISKENIYLHRTIQSRTKYLGPVA